PPVVVTCGDFNATKRIKLKKALQEMVTSPRGQKKADRIEVKDNSFSVFGTGLDADDVFEHLSDFLDKEKWAGDSVNGRVLVGELDKCG
ncbi:MAG: hypothetical protein HQL34_13885, partial [Alphaproteobacteria bacterium]|nr:hypothetical protein [Alphaproteobacteria bacterium]